ncbi:MAG: hypothetical protein RBS24_00755 [Bacilli bacterium]|nr:hypothetical protein [Bacilli bacterium]
MKKITKIMLSLGSFALILAACHKPPVDATKFTITWKNDDGTVLEVDENVPKDTLPTYDGVTPLKESTAEFTYEFTGWNPEVTKVVSDMTYVAKYLAKAIVPETRYTVTAEEWSTLLGGSYSNATITTTQTMKNQLKTTNYVSKEIEGVIYEYDDIKTKASEHAGREVSFSKEDYATYCQKVEGTALTEEMWNEVINNPALGERSE